jgi:preprotein translocase subunit SecA
LMRGQFVEQQPPGSDTGPARMPTQHASRPTIAPAQAAPQQPTSPEAGTSPAAWAATPRNAPCPCGSGKRYKNCHGDVSAAAQA